MSEKQARNSRATVVGKVTSDKMNKTITVVSETRVMHPQFKKYLKRSTKLKAHDENGEARMGDVVEIAECRPLSKTKTFRLVRIIRRGKASAAAAEKGAQS